MTRSRSTLGGRGLLGALLLLAACGEPSSGPSGPSGSGGSPASSVLEIRESRSVHFQQKGGEEVGKLGLLERAVMMREVADRIHLTTVGAELTLLPRRLPAPARLEFDVYVLRILEEPQEGPMVLEVENPRMERSTYWRMLTTPLVVDVRTRSGEPGSEEAGEERRQVVRLERTPDGPRDKFSVSIDLKGEGVFQEIKLRFGQERGNVKPGTRLALLRPRLTFARTLAVDPEPEEKPKRVFLVTTDTLRADHLGCYGNEVVQSPHFDAFARDAALFEEAYSATNVTNPAHTSIFASLYLKDHKVSDNWKKLSTAVPTMIDVLSERGFLTAGFVSAYNFEPERSDLPGRFDHFDDCQDLHERRAEDVNLELFPWLAEHTQEDLFVWVHYFDAHMPYQPPAPYDRMYDQPAAGKIAIPIDYKGNTAWFAESDELSHYKNLYLGEVSYLDHHFGAFVAKLRELGMYEDAIVVVLSDHGEALGEHEIYCEHTGVYEATTHIPLLVKFPGSEFAGRYPGLASSVDVYPTVFDALDFAIPHFHRGVSLRSLIDGGPGREAVFSEHARFQQVSLRAGDHRLLLGLIDEDFFPGFSMRDGRFELYDLSSDPEEQRDLAAGGSPSLSGLKGSLGEFMATAHAYTAEEIAATPEDIETMAKIGYVFAEDDGSGEGGETPYEEALRHVE